MSREPRTPSIATQVSRRRFLRDMGVAAGCVATGAALMGCEVAEVKVSGGGDATELAFDFSDAKFADLATVGKMVAVNVGSQKLILIRSDADTVAAVTRICPHAGFDLSPDQQGSWLDTTKRVKCAVHGSEFTSDGKYVAKTVSDGSDVANLSAFPVQFDKAAGTGVVDLAGA